MKKEYDKLVRDKIPDIIHDQGKKVCFRILDEDESIEYLEKKLDEEVAELHESKSIEEIADVFEVLFSLIDALGYDDHSVIETMIEKHETRGGFDNRICLIEVEEND